MTQAELWQMHFAAMYNGLISMSLLLTIISGYLVAAYFVGGRLTRYQTATVSLLFLLGAVLSGINAMIEMWRAFHFLDQLAPFGVRRLLPYSYLVAAGILLLLLIPAALYFMYQIRRTPNLGAVGAAARP